MAVLLNQAHTLRLSLELVDREVAPPGTAPPLDALRILGTAALEYFDRRDQSFWPILRLPVVYFAGTDPRDLADATRELCSQRREGFGFHAGAQRELTLHVAREPAGAFVVEVGLDLAAYLVETSGVSGEPGRELALFRFTTSTAELVTFADALTGERDRLPVR